MVKNKLYRQFLDTGLIRVISEGELLRALANVKGDNIKEGRSLLIVLYYTGARPVEVLNLKGNDIKRENGYLVMQMPYSKRGKTRPIYLKYSKALVKELYTFVVAMPPDMFLFYNYKGHYVRAYKTAKGEIKEKIETTDRLRYYFKIWFKGIIGEDITPYYLRHNRFSKLAMAGLTDREIKQLKGSGSIDSYTHLSSKTAKETAKKID